MKSLRLMTENIDIPVPIKKKSDPVVYSIRIIFHFEISHNEEFIMQYHTMKKFSSSRPRNFNQIFTCNFFFSLYLTIYIIAIKLNAQKQSRFYSYEYDKHHFPQELPTHTAKIVYTKNAQI